MGKVIHVGPSKSKGGMATVIDNLSKNPPNGWISETISTRGDGLLSVIYYWIKAKIELSSRIRSGKADVIHIHVTHSMSWWRKVSMMRTCERNGIPSVVHIHSGKFDEFCAKSAGKSVSRELSKPNRKTVVLEKRWKKSLEKWIPSDSVVINNSSFPIADRKNHQRGDEIKLLLLSRKSSIKGQKFAIEVLKSLHDSGANASLTLTGIATNQKIVPEGVKFVGWVSDDERKSLISQSDFLLSPSKYEGSSMSVIESIVTGLPCIVSKASEETVGITDLVVDDFSPEKWAKRIIQLSKEEEYNKCVEKILKISARYSVETNNKKIAELYGELTTNSL